MNTGFTTCSNLDNSEYVCCSCQYASKDFLDPPEAKMTRKTYDEKSCRFQKALFVNPVKTEINETEAGIEGMENTELLKDDFYIKQEIMPEESRLIFSEQIPTKVTIEKIEAMLKVPDINKEAYDDLTFNCVELQNFKEEYLGLNESSSSTVDIAQEKPNDTSTESLSGENILDKNEEDLGNHGDANETTTYKCRICGYEAIKKCTLTRHLLTHKTVNEGDIFKCDTCEFQTKYKSSIRVHLLRHKDNRLIKRTCDICDYETYYKNDLKNHLQQHRVTIFRCDTCDFLTDKERKLKRHSLRHKSTDEVEIFRCGECPFYTRYKSSLISHIRDHKKKMEVHECSKCDYKTDKAFDIRLHLLVHENEQKN